MLRPILFSLAAASLAVPAPAADWPQWRGPNRDGKSAETGLAPTWPAAGPKLLWSVEDVGSGYGTPAVVGDKFYILGSQDDKAGSPEWVACRNTADGKEVWRTPLNNKPVKFLDRWGGGPRSTPTVDGDRLYVFGPGGELTCVNRADGKVVWAKNVAADFGGNVPGWGYSESPLVDGDKVVVTPGKAGGMLALNKTTGSVVWQCKDDLGGAGYSSIIPADVNGVRQYVQQSMTASCFGVSAADGKLLWKGGEIERRTAVIPTPVVADGMAFFTAGYGAGCELYKLADGKKVYSKNKVVQNHHGGVIRVGDHVYGHSDSGGWVCFAFKEGSGEAVWASNKLGKGSIGYADGHFFCYAEGKGTLARIKATPDGWQETGRFDIPKTSPTRPSAGKVWAHPVIADGKLFLRDYELLYCYDLRNP